MVKTDSKGDVRAIFKVVESCTGGSGVKGLTVGSLWLEKAVEQLKALFY